MHLKLANYTRTLRLLLSATGNPPIRIVITVCKNNSCTAINRVVKNAANCLPEVAPQKPGIYGYTVVGGLLSI